MIVKNANYGELSGVTVVEFGKGTVRLITAFEPKKHGDLMFRTCNKVALGHTRKLNKGEKADIKKLAPEIVFRFYKTESIDIVIKELMNLKEAILKGEFPAAPNQVDEMSAKLMNTTKTKEQILNQLGWTVDNGNNRQLFEQIISQAMSEYAKQKCSEQRNICYDLIHNNKGDMKCSCEGFVVVAKAPDFDN